MKTGVASIILGAAFLAAGIVIACDGAGHWFMVSMCLGFIGGAMLGDGIRRVRR